MAGADEIRERGNNLSIALYVRSNNGRPNQNTVADSQAPYGVDSLDKAIAEWQQSSARLRKSMGGLFKALNDSTLS